MLTLQIIAITIGATGSYLIYRGWKKRSLIAILGWGSLIASLPIWMVAEGAEFGIVYGLSLPAIYAWLGIVSEHKWQKPKNLPLKLKGSEPIRGKKIIVNFLHVLYLFPLLMMTSIATTLFFITSLPFNETNQLALGIFVLPLLWAGLAFWYLAAKDKRIAVIATIVCCIVSNLYLYG